MPLDASLLTLGGINRGKWPTTFGTRQGSIFSHAMNDYLAYRLSRGTGRPVSISLVWSLNPGSFEVEIRPHEILTIRLEGSPTARTN